jgi:hypothetical protein
MPTTAVPVTAVRLDAPLKARITAAQAELAREMPGLTPTFSDTVRVLLNEALAARAAASPTAASPPAADPDGFDELLAAADARKAGALRAIAARNAAALVPASRGAGGITLHRATNGASIATVVANDPK